MDANLNHCLATGRSVTGCLHFVNHTPIDSYLKRQATVETATYGSEFVASKTGTEQILCQHESHENMKEFFVKSCHLMPHPIVSRLKM